MTRRMHVRIVTVLFFTAGALFAVAAPASAQRRSDEPTPIDDRDDNFWDHFEISMGFMGGGRDYTDTGFDLREGEPPGDFTLDAAFTESPYDSVQVMGLRYDMRLVVSYVRMTAGVDVPFAVFNPRDSAATYSLGGENREVTVRSISPIGLRFGIGAEYPVGAVAPFVDLMGGVHWVNTVVDVDGTELEYGSSAFALSARAGLRLHVRKWFFASAAGEIGLVGDIQWGAELAVGFAIM